MSTFDPTQTEIHSKAPVRMSFAGGGTDVSPFPERYGGMVVNATISTYMTARLRLRDDSRVVIQANTRPEPIVYPALERMNPDGRLDFIKAIVHAMYKRRNGLEICLHSSVPMRSGLGGSGAMCVAVQGAFNHLLGRQCLSPHQLAELAFEIETTVLHNASGRQDQYAAVFGGINHFEFLDHAVRVNPIHVDRELANRLSHGLLLLWLGGRPAASGAIIEEQTRSVEAGGRALAAMLQTKRHVLAMCDAVASADLQRIGELLDLLWAEKKQFSAQVSNGRIDAIYAALRQAGMIGGKITGAGGGGHMMACCLPEYRDAIAAAAAGLGIEVVPFVFTFEGLVTWETPLAAAIAEGAYASVPHPWAASSHCTGSA